MQISIDSIIISLHIYLYEHLGELSLSQFLIICCGVLMAAPYLIRGVKGEYGKSLMKN